MATGMVTDTGTPHFKHLLLQVQWYTDSEVPLALRLPVALAVLHKLIHGVTRASASGKLEFMNSATGSDSA